MKGKGGKNPKIVNSPVLVVRNRYKFVNSDILGGRYSEQVSVINSEIENLEENGYENVKIYRWSLGDGAAVLEYTYMEYARDDK